MLTERLLPPDEWPRLAGTLLDPAWRTFNGTAKIIVFEDEGRIVACTSLSQWWHLEGTWIDPAYRGRITIARRGLKVIRQLFKVLHIGEVLMMATTPRNAAMCRKLGDALELPGKHFAVIVEKNGRPVVWPEKGTT